MIVMHNPKPEIRNPKWLVGVMAALACAAVAGCSRLDVINGRLNAIGDAQARTLVRDTLWAEGSKYRWADHGSIRAEVTWTEHRPLGDIASDEVWHLDLWSGQVRVDRPGAVVADPDDLAARALAAGRARIVRELLPMPLSLTYPGQEVSYVGTRTGVGEARTWQRLLVAYQAAGRAKDDRMVVEILQAARRVDAALIRWSEFPFVGRLMRVEMDQWRPVQEISISRRWRFTPVDDKGAALGPARYTVLLKHVEFDKP